MTDTCIDRGGMERIVSALTAAGTDPGLGATVDGLLFSIQKFVEGRNERSVNQGDYDCTVGLTLVQDHLRRRPAYQDLVRGLGIRDDPAAAGLITSILVERLIGEGTLLYVYDRQRVRSRIAEMARYLAHLRQRFDPETYAGSPRLTQMVKLRARSRWRPRRSRPLKGAMRDVAGEKGRVNLDPAIYRILERDPSRLNNALQLLFEVIEEVIPHGDEGVLLTQLQSETWGTLFHHLIDRRFDSEELSFIIASDTGSGKTEAFLYPLLLYTLLTYDEGGTKGILIYPRIDLCNNQLGRLLRYIFLINQRVERSQQIRIGIQHSGLDKVSLPCPHPGCDGDVTQSVNGSFVCSGNTEHRFPFLVDKQKSADILITTPDSLHRRLMDKHGKRNLWAPSRQLPKLIVFDEAHLYAEQSGIHVTNLVRRLRYKIRSAPAYQRQSSSRDRSGNRDPLFVGVSATIGDPQRFGRALFSTSRVEVLEPRWDDHEEVGREYIVFMKATDPRRVRITDDEDGTDRFTTATNLSAMIQAAFCFYHTIRKDEQKNRLLGFVDSIDGITRLGVKLHNADTTRTLWQLRAPDSRIDTASNPLCARCDCSAMPPHPYLQRCRTYDAGECWWLMGQSDLHPMAIHLHKSQTTQDCQGNNVDSDDWDLMITTSALEVGFDHPGVIGTFQYRSPKSVPGFIQRIGRGGRAPQDMPVSLVVFGNSPQDRFFFHHTTYLTDPTAEQLSIPLDVENDYVRSMHITSFVYDYISLTEEDSVVASAYNEINAETVLSILQDPEGSLLSAVCTAFDLSVERGQEALDQLRAYYQSCVEELLPGRPETRYDRLVGYWGHKDVMENIIEPLKEIQIALRYEHG